MGDKINSCFDCDRMPEDGVCHLECCRHIGSDVDIDLYEKKESCEF